MAKDIYIRCDFFCTMQQTDTLPNEELLALITATEDLVFLMSSSGEILNVWISNEDQLFIPRHELIGKTLYEVKPAEEAGKMSDAIAAVMNGEPVAYVEYPSPVDTTQYFQARFKLLHPESEKIVVSVRDISAQKAEQDAVKRNEAKYYKLIQNSQDLITVLDRNGIIIFDSFSVFSPFGFNEKLEGRCVFDFIHPDDVNDARETFARAIQKCGTYGPFEFRFITTDNNYRYIEVIGNNLFHESGINGYVLNSRDVTERRKMEENLAQTNARLNTILESTDSVIFAVDNQLRYIAFNQQHKQVIKQLYDAEINIGDLCLLKGNANADADSQWLRPHIEKALNGEQFSEQYETKLLNGNLLITDVSFNPIHDGQGKITGVAVSYKDITQQVIINRELEKAKNEAEDAARAKSDFLSNMSHEIRTPINAIMGMTDLLLERIHDNESLEYLRSIKYSSDNLLVVINDILDFSKIEAGKVNLEYIDFNLYESLGAISRIFGLKAGEKDLAYECAIDPQVPRFVKGDPYRLNQILLNLIGNAIKFTSKGHVKLQVHIQNETTDKLLIEFVISDTGIGIPEDKIATIFESFTQAYTDITRRFGGTGLGLAITQKLTALMGGNIAIESKLNSGSTFTVTLPFGKTAATEIPHQDKQTTKERDLSHTRVLIVEDNPLNQLVIKHILSSWKAEFEVASNGQEAINLLTQEDFDIVLMDLQMPEMSGYEATQLIRSKNSPVRNPLVPIIAITADAFAETRRRVLEKGMNDFISKPFEKDELYSKIVRLCK